MQVPVGSKKTVFLKVKIVSKHRKEQKLRHNIVVLCLSQMKRGSSSSFRHNPPTPKTS